MHIPVLYPVSTNASFLGDLLCIKSHVLFEILTAMRPALLENLRYFGLTWSPIFSCLLSFMTKRIALLSQTVDTYYRRCSSASYVGNVSIPLLCISALDDPVCTREAIPWDECRWMCSCCISECFIILSFYSLVLKLSL